MLRRACVIYNYPDSKIHAPTHSQNPSVDIFEVGLATSRTVEWSLKELSTSLP